ncbi:MAG: dihydroxy-acid dehydratase, partial [Pseudomonadota bacterium]
AMAGGPLGIVKDGDWITLDCAGGLLNLEISEAEMAERQAARVIGSAPGPKTGYQKLYIEHVLQADEGCDFDFLVGNRGSAVPRHSH